MKAKKTTRKPAAKKKPAATRHNPTTRRSTRTAGRKAKRPAARPKAAREQNPGTLKAAEWLNLPGNAGQIRIARNGRKAVEYRRRPRRK